MIHTTATWAALAPTRPADASNGDDPAYKLTDLDDLVFQAGLYNLRVMINITGTPKWANGGKAPNVHAEEPGRPDHVREDARHRYNGTHGTRVGRALVGLERAEPAAVPDPAVRRARRSSAPANYAKLYKAAYAGIKAGNPLAKVAIGETSAQRPRQAARRRQRDQSRPGRSRSCSRQAKGLKFDAWAHHPYPTSPNCQADAEGALSERDALDDAAVREGSEEMVPPSRADLDHRVRPRDQAGRAPRRHAGAAGCVREAGTDRSRRSDPNIQMFIWFIFRDSAGNPWQSGLIAQSGANKPAFASFGRGRAADRRLDEHGQGRCAGPRDDVRARTWPTTRSPAPRSG